jgi:hypothetical protein
MKTETLHPVADYVQESINFLTREEGFGRLGLPYFDTATPPRATIGYGFNIEVPDYLLLVLRQMGIVNGTMTTTQINTIRSAFTTAINITPHTGDTVLQTSLNQIARQYLGPTGQFRINTTQGRNIIREIILGLNDGNIQIQGKEARLDALLRDPITGQSTLAHNSKEYVAVMSLFYNAESLVNSEKKLLVNAIISDNRAEAWYEIRYNSNSGKTRSQGIANRRYREADLFGLYDGGTLTADEQIAQAKEIMRMFTRYEAFAYNDTRPSDYENEFGLPANINSFSETIKPARDLLVTEFAMGNTIDGLVLVGKGLDSYDYIEKGNWNDYFGGRGGLSDLIFGEKGDDKLLGYAGNDVI